MLIPMIHYYVCCDYNGCEKMVGGYEPYQSRDMALDHANFLGWLRRNGLDFCPRHRGDAAVAKEERCRKCGWPVYADPKQGCTRENCSMRS